MYMIVGVLRLPNWPGRLPSATAGIGEPLSPWNARLRVVARRAGLTPFGSERFVSSKMPLAEQLQIAQRALVVRPRKARRRVRLGSGMSRGGKEKRQTKSLAQKRVGRSLASPGWRGQGPLSCRLTTGGFDSPATKNRIHLNNLKLVVHLNNLKVRRQIFAPPTLFLRARVSARARRSASSAARADRPAWSATAVRSRAARRRRRGRWSR